MERQSLEQTQNDVYVRMMVDALKRKKEILVFLYDKTKEQEQLLKDEQMSQDAFQATIDAKGEKIDALNELDDGFDTLFKYVKEEIEKNRMAYKEEIQTMQKLIGEVSELGIQIQALEHQNSGHFKVYLANQRKAIKEFHVNNKTASSYYQNMANTHKSEQSYFFNEAK